MLGTAKIREGAALRGKGRIQALQPLHHPGFIIISSMMMRFNWKPLRNREVVILPTCSYSAAGAAAHAYSILRAGDRDLGNTEQYPPCRASGRGLATAREGR